MRLKDEAKEKLILEASIALIGKSGLDGLKMASIAQKSGIAIGTLYIYFRDKEELIKSIYKYIVQTSAKNFVYNFEEGMPTKAKIKGICRAYLENYIKNPGYSAFLEQFYRSVYYHSNSTFADVRNNAYKPVYMIIQEGQTLGVIKDIDPNIITVATAGTLREVCRLFNISETGLEEDKWEAVFSIVWDGMRA